MRRGFLGLGPLCGTGVLSLIELTSTPLAINARIADSRPLPTPRTIASTDLRPINCAFSARSSPIFAAANGVHFFAPVNPSEPEEDHISTFTSASASDTMVLLYVD